MVLKRVYIVGLILFSGLFSARAAAPARLPLLPLPQAAAAEADPGVAAEYGRIEIRKEGVADSLTAAVEEELAALAVSGAGGTFVVECRVTEKASSLRRALKGAGETFLAPYADSIGTQGYLLSFDRDRASLTARTPRGIYYGLQSVKQLLRDGWSGRAKVADWPDMPVRVFFDDISRGPLSNLGEVKRQIRQLAEWKYTDLTFYIEHIVKVPSYPDFAPVNGHFTMEEVREICRYAARYNMEVIGGFQSFGHFENILALPRYAPMGETPSLISPLDPEARKFLKAVLEELSDNFSSKYFNVNCDETWDLAKGRSREYVARVGADRFYADHVRFLYDVLKAKTTGATKLAIIGDYDTVLSLDLLKKTEAEREKKEKAASQQSAGGFTVVSEDGTADEGIENLIRQRAEAKKAKNFAEADRIRDELKAQGVEVTDMPGGAKWKRV